MSEAMIVNYPEDVVVLEQGDASRCLYKVLSGNVGLFLNYGREDEYLVGILSYPSCFGEMTVLAGRPSPYTVVTLADTALLRVPESDFERFVRDNHQNAIMIMKTMARNLAMVNTNMELLIDELTELGRGGSVNDAALQRLVAQYSGVDGEMLPSAERPSEEAAAEDSPVEVIDIEAYLPGHRDHPNVTHPEYLQNVYEKAYTCPHCGKSFTSWRIFHSKLIPLADAEWMERYDGRIFYKDFDPSWYEIVTCPACCFSAMSGCFLEPHMLLRERYAEQLKQTAQSLRINFDAERDLDFVYAQHYLALVCAQGFLQTQRRQLTAQLWRNLAWLYEDAGDKELEQRAAAAAAQAMVDALDLHDRFSLQQQKNFLDIAAMFEKAGDTLHAREWALKVRQANEGSLYGDIAGRLIFEIREKIKVNMK